MCWFVLVCMSTYMLVFDYKLIVNIPIWCHTALESTFHAISTVDTALMSLCLDFQSTLWQDGQKERPWQLPVPDLTTLSRSPPGEHVSILPCMLCRLVPVSPADIRGRSPKKLDTGAIQTGLRQVKHLPIFALDDTNTVCKAVAGPPQLAFFRSVVPEGVCHRAVTVNQPLNAFAHAPSCWTEKPKTNTYRYIPNTYNTCQYIPLGPHKIHTDTYQYIHSTH